MFLCFFPTTKHYSKRESKREREQERERERERERAREETTTDDLEETRASSWRLCCAWEEEEDFGAAS